jgi:hypothetical protein
MVAKTTTSLPQEIKEGKIYSFPIGVKAFKYTEDETNEVKVGLNFFLRKAKIESLED